MKILVTGSNGFIGKNLTAELKNRGHNDVFEYDKETNPKLLDRYCKEAEFIFHLAGINRPNNQSEYMKGNYGFTSTLLGLLEKYKNTCPVMISSSVQALLDNAYGKSKKAAENLLFKYSEKTGAKVLVYRFPNIFGKWCRPNYNNVVATFCYNIANDLPISISDPGNILKLIYIDDLVEELISSLKGKENTNGIFCEVKKQYIITLDALAKQINSFKESRTKLSIPNMANEFTKKLYSTYLSYLPLNDFSYNLKVNEDSRGSFTEFIKTPDRGQVSVNISKPGITKGNHWHHTKNEKFLVIHGTGAIRFRKIGTEKVIEYYVRGDKFQVVEIPPGYVHSLTNIGENDLITIMWANETYDPNRSDTNNMEV